MESTRGQQRGDLEQIIYSQNKFTPLELSELLIKTTMMCENWSKLWADGFHHVQRNQRRKDRKACYRVYPGKAQKALTNTPELSVPSQIDTPGAAATQQARLARRWKDQACRWTDRTTA